MDARLGFDTLDRRRLWSPRFVTHSYSRALFLSWRVFACAYVVSVSVFNAILVHGPAYMTYLTVHSVWVTTSYFLLALACALLVRAFPSLGAGPRLEPLSLSRGFYAGAWAAAQRALLVLFVIAVSFELVVVSLYWTLLAQAQRDDLHRWDNVESHGIKLLFIYVDLLFSSQRLPDPLFVVPLCSGLIYLCLNVGVTLSSGHPVYGVLTWHDAGSAIIVIGALIFLVVAYFVASLIAHVRDGCASRLRGSDGGVAAGVGADDAHPADFDDDPAPLPCASCRRTQKTQDAAYEALTSGSA
jgi:hypothetical protein